MSFTQPLIDPDFYTRKSLGAVNLDKVVAFRKSRFSIEYCMVSSIVFTLDNGEWGPWCYFSEEARDLTHEALLEESGK